MTRFDGKTAVVTGAASGIGEASAIRLAKEGATVVVADVDKQKGTETVDQIEATGSVGEFIKTDVSDEGSVEELVNEVVERHGSLDIAHNNAGIRGKMATVDTMSEDTWDQVLDINLKGIRNCLKHEIQVMKENGGGAIVNTASETGLVGAPGISSYVASKHGVIGLTRSAALENARANIRVNAVCPGPIETGMTDEEIQEQVLNDIPMQRMGEPEEIASSVSWLLSEDASFVTGHPLVVDGGRLAD